MTVIKSYAGKFLTAIVLLLLSNLCEHLHLTLLSDVLSAVLLFFCSYTILDAVVTSICKCHNRQLSFLEEKIMTIKKTYAKEILTAIVLLLPGSFCASLHLALLSHVLTAAGHYYIVKTILRIHREHKDNLHLQDVCAYLLCAVRKAMRIVCTKINKKMEKNRS